MFSISSYPFVDNHGASLMIGFLGFLLLLYILKTAHHAYGSALRAVPGPPLAPFTRLYHVSMTWNGKIHEESRRLHAKYGPVVRTGPNHVSLSEPSAISLIFGVSSKFIKSDFYKPFDMMLDGKPLPSMFSVRDPADHRHLKQPVAGTFALSSMRQLEPLVDECTDIFIDAMAKQSPAPVDFGAWLQWYAFDVIGSITFLKRFGFMEQGRDVNSMIENIEGGLVYLSIISYVPELHRWLLGNPTLMKILDRIEAARKKNPFPNILRVTRGQIKAYDEEQRNYARGDMLSWIREQRAKNEARMGDRDLINHLTNNLLAGSDTTAISLRSVFYYALKTPGVMASLVREIEEAERDGTISQHVTLAEGLKLPYLQAVIKEAMRVHPGVGSPLWRITPKGGATISGYFIPEGTEVGMSAWVVHQDKTVFGEDANLFRPERWLDADPGTIAAMDRAFLSFGFGARTCIGKNISIMEMSKFVPQVLRKFDLEWAGPDEQWTVNTRWFSQQTGVNMIFRPRHQTFKG